MATRKPVLRLNQAQRAFALAYLANGFNATRAYHVAYPTAGYRTAQVNGHRLRHEPKVVAFLAPYLEKHWKAQQMGGEEALALVASDARCDVRRLFGEDGKMLRPQDWPDDVASSIESFQLLADGGVKIRLASKTSARRTILEQTGQIKTLPDSLDELAAAMRRDRARVEAGTE